MTVESHLHHIQIFHATTRAGVKYSLQSEAGGSTITIQIGNQALALLPEDMAQLDTVIEQAESWRVNGLEEIINGSVARRTTRISDIKP